MNLCIKLVKKKKDYHYIRMHGQQNAKFATSVLLWQFTEQWSRNLHKRRAARLLNQNQGYPNVSLYQDARSTKRKIRYLCSVMSIHRTMMEKSAQKTSCQIAKSKPGVTKCQQVTHTNATTASWNISLDFFPQSATPNAKLYIITGFWAAYISITKGL